MHPTSNCRIDVNAYCNNLDVQTAITFTSSSINNNWYVGGDWTTVAGTTNNFYGRLNFVDTGDITNNVYYNHMILGAGTINSNGYDIFVRTRFTSTSNNVRALLLDNSTFSIGGAATYNSYPRALWNTSNSANLTINDGLIHIQSMNNSNNKSIHFGNNNLQYDSVIVEANNYELDLYGASNFNYAEWNGDLLVRGNNTYDTLVFLSLIHI